ncbi:MAG TPA: hypothetical protein VF187_10925 [Gemmatimonadales bacterium]
MSLPLVVLRLIHVLFGVLWVGFAVFVTLFLGPAVRDAGPDGGKVMAALQRRGVMTIIPGLGIVTLLSGLWLYWHLSNGFQADYLRSPTGHALGMGGVVAILAFGIGMSVARPAMMRAMALSQSLGSNPAGPDHAAQVALITKLRARADLGGRITAVLLLLAVAAMGVARYL